MSVFKRGDRRALWDMLVEPFRWIQLRNSLIEIVPEVATTSEVNMEQFIDDLTGLNVSYSDLQIAFKRAGIIAYWPIFAEKANVKM